MSRLSFVFFVSIFLYAPVAYAQLPDSIGVRAQGMSGAFTALADDATASWWNPAGLASGAYLNVIVEYGEGDDPPLPTNLPHRAFALAFPALGLSYYHMTVSEIAAAASTAGSAGSRQDPGIPIVRAVEVSQFGATVGQSIGNHFVLASTLKLVRGNLGLTDHTDSDAGLDIGGMVLYQNWRAGVAVRNVREVTLGEGDGELVLKRQARVGLAWSTAASTAYGGATVAADVDILDIPTVFGEERRVAVGGELWMRQRVVGGRGGFSLSTIGERREAYSGGVSVALRHGIFVEGQLTGGSDELRKGWNVGLRLTF
jgi:hypothetical protein